MKNTRVKRCRACDRVLETNEISSARRGARCGAIVPGTLTNRWRSRARQLKTEVRALSLACRDARVPSRTRWLALLVVAYALSPIDLIPDFIPVLGLLDDLILLPLGIALVLKSVPAEVLQECRERAATASFDEVLGRRAAVVIIVFWLLSALVFLRFLWRFYL